jgi:hypothetical protein
MPQAARTGSAGAPGCILKWLASRNRSSSRTPDRSRVGQAANSAPIAEQIRPTVDFDSAASGPRTSARVASMSRSDRPRTQPEITSDSNAWVRVTPAPNRREQNAWSVPRNLGRCSSTAPIVVFRVIGGWWRLRLPGRSVSPRRWYRARPKNSSTSASKAVWNTTAR